MAQSLAERSGSPEGTAFVQACRGISMFVHGRWRQARELLEVVYENTPLSFSPRLDEDAEHGHVPIDLPVRELRFRRVPRSPSSAGTPSNQRSTDELPDALAPGSWHAQERPPSMVSADSFPPAGPATAPPAPAVPEPPRFDAGAPAAPPAPLMQTLSD